MNKKLISTLIAGVALAAATPVFADSFHDRGYGHERYGEHYRDFDRHGYRGFEHRRVVVVERPYAVARPYVVAQPIYYPQPAPAMGVGAAIGAAIGGYIDSHY